MAAMEVLLHAILAAVSHVRVSGVRVQQSLLIQEGGALWWEKLPDLTYRYMALRRL